MKLKQLKDIPFGKAAHGPYEKQQIFASGEVANLNQLGRIILKPGQIAENHSHDSFSEIMLVEKGRGKIIINGNEEKEIEEGSIILAEVNDVHGVVNDSDSDLQILFLEVNK